MNNISRFLTAIAFSAAGAAAHANGAVEQSACGSSTCFQLTPVAEKGGDAFLAENGSSHTPQGKWLDGQTA
ncbi:hypothetical protein [Pseudomonas sp. MAG733B]|uniref:hypothetical protein n=1 Tax=Pseudomonas sp. MAG733B TaxID=3122079 RepID=UPI000FC3C75C